MSSQYFKTDIQFHADGKQISFSVVTNSPNIKGLSINDAVHNWVYRTKIYTDKSFCKYFNSKNTGYICITMDEYNTLK